MKFDKIKSFNLHEKFFDNIKDNNDFLIILSANKYKIYG